MFLFLTTVVGRAGGVKPNMRAVTSLRNVRVGHHPSPPDSVLKPLSGLGLYFVCLLGLLPVQVQYYIYFLKMSSWRHWLLCLHGVLWGSDSIIFLKHGLYILFQLWTKNVIQNRKPSPSAKHWASMSIFISISSDFEVRKHQFGSWISHCDVIGKSLSTVFSPS